MLIVKLAKAESVKSLGFQFFVTPAAIALPSVLEGCIAAVVFILIRMLIPHCMKSIPNFLS